MSILTRAKSIAKSNGAAVSRFVDVVTIHCNSMGHARRLSSELAKESIDHTVNGVVITVVADNSLLSGDA